MYFILQKVRLIPCKNQENESFSSLNYFNQFFIMDEISPSTNKVGVFMAKDLLNQEIVVLKRIEYQSLGI